MTKITRIIKEARDQARLTALDFAQGIFDNFVELHGDRSFRDDGAVIGGIGTLNGQSVTVVGIQKGRNLQDNLRRNFGQPHPEGYRKALRLMKQVPELLKLFLALQAELLEELAQSQAYSQPAKVQQLEQHWLLEPQPDLHSY